MAILIVLLSSTIVLSKAFTAMANSWKICGIEPSRSLVSNQDRMVSNCSEKKGKQTLMKESQVIREVYSQNGLVQTRARKRPLTSLTGGKLKQTFLIGLFFVPSWTTRPQRGLLLEILDTVNVFFFYVFEEDDWNVLHNSRVHLSGCWMEATQWLSWAVTDYPLVY